MPLFSVFSDSACDLSADLITQHNIGIVTFGVTLDGANYFRDGVDMSHAEFFQALLREKYFPKTSTPSIADYTDAFTKTLQEGQDIICLCLSSTFSASYQSAMNAKSMLMEEYPERTIIIIDSELASAVQGRLVLEAARLRDAGMTAHEASLNIEAIRDTAKIYLTADSLEYLQRGGRIGKASAIAGTLLNIKPIILMMRGELYPIAKVRGRKKTIAEILSKVSEELRGKEDVYNITVVHGMCEAEGAELTEAFRARGFLVPYGLQQAGATIGAHIGPTVIGVGYMKVVL